MTANQRFAQSEISLDSFSFTKISLGETLFVALVYIISARVGQILAIEPGNITPVWLPSGLMLALAFIRGTRIWLGVFIGAFVGNIWAYFSIESFWIAFQAIIAATMNGIGDVLSTVLMAYVIHLMLKTRYPFTSIFELIHFVLWGVIVGPLLSAIFGVMPLVAFSFIEADKLVTAFSTWWVGDGVGAMLLGPLVISLNRPRRLTYPHYWLTFAGLIIFVSLGTLSIFKLISLPDWSTYVAILIIVPFIVLMVQYGHRVVFTLQFVVASIAIVATALERGPFAVSTGPMALVELQIFVFVFSLVIFAVAILAAQNQISQTTLKQQKQTLEKLYRQDQLTGLWNRYRIKEFLDQELKRFNREKQAFGVIMMDIDNFKQINDKYGHNVGDQVLVELSELVSKDIRETDLFGRWGGEEFILIVCNTSIEALKILAEKIRTITEESEFSTVGKLTISLGVTLIKPGDSRLALIDRADEALYLSKSQQKNCVSVVL